MLNTILSLALALQLSAGPVISTHTVAPHHLPPSETRLWWGMIDPEMSVWFARLPDTETNRDSRVLWDWSWQGFLAALFGISPVKEAYPDAAHA